ncbi:MAG: hypothetical protein KY475_13290, partial [Planctomycetes bacterium]|nr:hypothetical protein [Planctomycetota bacterium]
DAPEAPGLVELKEADRYLYIAQSNNLRPALAGLAHGDAFQIVASGFWKPDPNEISVQFAVGDEFADIGGGKWAARLISEFSPVFNWPMSNKAA